MIELILMISSINFSELIIENACDYFENINQYWKFICLIIKDLFALYK